MIAGLVLGFLADVVFDAVASTRRSFDAEMERYLRRRQFLSARKPTPTPAP